METTNIPRVIMTLNPDSKLYLENKKSSLDLPNNISFLTPIEVLEQKIPLPDKREGLTFTIHPIKREYVLFESLKNEEEIILRRREATKAIVAFLGGTNLKISEISKEDLKKQVVTEVGVKVDVPATGSVEGNVKDSQGQCAKLESSITLTAIWDGHFSTENYEQAKLIAQTYGLEKDPVIEFLLIQRNPTNINPIKRQTYEVTLNKEIVETYNLLATIATQVNAFSLSGKYHVEQEQKTFKEEKLYFEVEFGNEGCLLPSKDKMIEIENRIAIIHSKSHEHTNKILLDTITVSRMESWDNSLKEANAYTDGLNTEIESLEGRINEHNKQLVTLQDASHQHTNHAVLSSLSQEDVDSWRQVVVDVPNHTDTIAKIDGDLAEVKISISELDKDSHHHANQVVLDNLDCERMFGWDNAEQNAKKHTDDSIECVKKDVNQLINELNRKYNDLLNANAVHQRLFNEYKSKVSTAFIFLGVTLTVSLLLSILIVCGIL